MSLLAKFRSCFALSFILATSVASAQTPPPNLTPETKDIEALDPAQRAICNEHFSGQTRQNSRNSCLLGIITFKKQGKDAALQVCKTSHQAKTNADVACRIGVLLSDENTQNHTTLATRLKLCRGHYPMNTELDAFLQESCMVGAFLAHDSQQVAGKKPSLKLCEQFSEERAFVGPCGTGLSLVFEETSSGSVPVSEHNRLCSQYFDQKAFHQGYRACLNARALSLSWAPKGNNVVNACSNVTSGKGNETEQAACVVGASIWHGLTQPTRDANPRFRHCGTNKVHWEERDTLACLTAASLLAFDNRGTAQGVCKSVFAGRKSGLRGECQRAVDMIASKPLLDPAPIAVKAKNPTTTSEAGPTDDDTPETEAAGIVEDMWPEAPDFQPETTAKEGAIDPTEESRLPASSETP